MIEIELRNAGALAKTLEKLRAQAVPHAVRGMLNHVAFDARREWHAQIDKAMIVRNQFTKRSIRVEKARGTHLGRMQAVVGSVLEYMAKQEFGGQERARGKRGVPIPTSSAAGMGMKARPRTRMVRARNYLSAIRLVQAVPGSKQRKNAAAIRMARARGDGVAYLDTGKRRGLYRIPPGKRAKPRMLYDLSRRTVNVPKRPTLQRTLRVIEPNFAMQARRAIMDELVRAKLVASAST